MKVVNANVLLIVAIVLVAACCVAACLRAPAREVPVAQPKALPALPQRARRPLSQCVAKMAALHAVATSCDPPGGRGGGGGMVVAQGRDSIQLSCLTP